MRNSNLLEAIMAVMGVLSLLQVLGVTALHKGSRPGWGCSGTFWEDN